MSETTKQAEHFDETSSVSRDTPRDFFDPPGFAQLSRTLTEQGRKSSGSQNPTALSSPTVQELKLTSDEILEQDRAFDFEKELESYVQRSEAENIKARKLGVVFEGLHVVGLGSSASIQPTIGAIFNPLNIVRNIRKGRHPPIRNILADFEGLVSPGEMLLVLGRPGSGCSTFLKVLANQRDEYHAVEGEVYYDSLTPAQVAKNYRGDIQYCPEDDIHFPSLTVDQTLRFAAATRAPHNRPGGETRQQYIDNVTEIQRTVFGLNHVKDSPVGDAAIRGVSGGEKKRVSIAETLLTRSRITCWDNSTRGLDSSTALEFGRALRIATNMVKTSTIVSLYQAGENLYDVFDKVCVIYEGRMVYYGPASQAKQYFIDMGYQPAPRQTTPDFLVAVTDPNSRILINQGDRPAGQRGLPIPQTATEFAEYYKKSVTRQRNLEAMESYKREHVGQKEKVAAYKDSAKDEHAQHTRRKSPYTISLPMQIRIAMIRRLQIMRGNLAFQLLQTFVFAFQAVILGTTFLKLPVATSAFFSRGGVIFFSTFAPALFSMSEIPALFAQRPIILRHQKAAMYHPLVEALALTVVDIPFTLLTISVFSLILYFSVQLQQTASQFFVYYLFVVTITITMKAFFRGLAATFKDPAPAQAIAGVLLLVLSLYTGYQIPKPTMIGALRWITYINPVTYAFESLISNEFHTINGECSALIPRGPGYEGVSIANQVCSTVGSQPGQYTVDGNTFINISFGYHYSNLWRNFGILVAFGAFFIMWLTFFTEFNTKSSSQQSVVLFKSGALANTQEEHDDEEKGAMSTRTSTPIQEVVSEKKASHEALPSPPKMNNTFSWQRINYTVLVSGNRRQLLNDVSGFVAPGKLTALMGESGAGKTTLLNVLAERTGSGVITGDRFLNGQGLPADFQAQTGYVQQMDTHVPFATVREALRFSARLRQPASVPTAEKDAYAERCLKMCGLEAYADAMVGSLGVEHRKRTTIGVELAAKPGLLLFLDEPTSGLDSQSAWAIMTFLRELANNGQAILCTIHQPSAELFSTFDRLLLLAKGGKTVFFGDIGNNGHDMIEYFERGGARHCDPRENPAEYMLDVIGAGATATSTQDWHNTWLASDLRLDLQDTLDHIHAEGRNRPPVSSTLESTFATPWFYQVTQLLMRQHLAFWRNPTYLMAKIMLNTLAGLLIGFTFWRSKDSIQGSQNKLFAIFMGTILSAPLGGQIQVPYIKMRDIYEIRERSSRMYHWSALTLSQITIELPWNVLGSSIFFFCFFWTVGFPSDRAGFTYLMYSVSFPFYYTTLSLAVGSLAPTSEIGNLMYSLCFSFVLIFDGVLQPYLHLGWWRWMYHLSPFTYLVEALVGQAIGNQTITCAAKELVTVQPPAGQSCAGYMSSYISTFGGYLTNPDAISSCKFCSVRTTDQWMGPAFNIFYNHHWRNFGLFWAYIVFNFALVFLFTYLARVRQHKLLPALVKKLASFRKSESS